MAQSQQSRSIVESPRFMQLDQIPEAMEQASLQQVFQQASEHGTGGIIILSGHVPISYIITQILADGARDHAKEQSWEYVSRQQVGDFLRADPTPAVCVRVVNSDVSTALLDKAPAAVFQVRERTQPLGYYFNRDELSRTVHTPPPVFYCEAGHANSDPDSGNCGKCPRKLKS